MGVQKKTRKFGQMKRLIGMLPAYLRARMLLNNPGQRDARLYTNTDIHIKTSALT